jgi:phage gp16-like protein
MPAAKDKRARDLAKIHIAKKQLAMDDATYREMLLAVAGVDSAAKLTADGRRAVLAHLYRSGFSSKRSRIYKGRPDMDAQAGTGKQAMLKKIEAYLAEAGRSWAYAHAMAKRMSAKKVERIQWCTPADLHKIIAALEYDARRHGRFTG